MAVEEPTRSNWKAIADLERRKIDRKLMKMLIGTESKGEPNGGIELGV